MKKILALVALAIAGLPVGAASAQIYQGAGGSITVGGSCTGTPCPIGNGGTGATTAAGALTNLNGVSTSLTTPQTMAGVLNSPSLNGIAYATQFASIQAAIAYACNGTVPGSVMLPYGITVISSSVIVPSYCTVYGFGQGLSILQIAPLGGGSLSPAVISNSSETLSNPATLDTNIYLHDFTIDENAANNTGYTHAMLFANIANLIVERVETKDSDIGIGKGYTYSAENQQNIKIEDSYVHGAGVATATDTDCIEFQGENSFIDGNTLTNCTDSGLGLQGGTVVQTNHVSITNNIFANNARTCGVAAGPGPGSAYTVAATNTDITIIGNTHTCTNTYGSLESHGIRWTITGNIYNMSSGASSAATIYVNDSSDTAISGNQINGSSAEGIRVDADANNTPSGVTIAGNTIKNTGSFGIALSSVSSASNTTTLRGVILTGNTILNPGVTSASYGIEIGQNNNGGTAILTAIVAGNSITDSRLTHTMPYGIVELGSPTSLTILGNQINGYLTAQYSPATAGDITDPGNHYIGTTTGQASSTTTAIGLYGTDSSGVTRLASIQNTGSDFSLPGFDYSVYNGTTTITSAGGEPVVITPSSGILSVNGQTATTTLKTSVYTVATLPTGLPAGTQVVVSNATSLTAGVCVGGGSNYTIALYTGTVWNCM